MSDEAPARRKRVFLYDDELPNSSVRLPSSRRDETGLSKIEQRFCELYTAHYDGNRAATEAGYAPGRAWLMAARLLKDSRIRRRIAAIEADRLRRMRFDGDLFLARELVLAQADVTELIESWIPPCRYCWGRNNEYQRTHAEFQGDWDEWMRMPARASRRGGRPATLNTSFGDVLVYDGDGAKLPFDERGGDGFDPGQPPNPGCPNCRGRGQEDPERGTIPYIRLKDSRQLSEAGRILYAGVRRTPRGLEQLVQNQDAARSRLMGMLTKFLELRATGAAIPPEQPAIGFQMGLISGVADLLTADPRSMSDRQLDQLLARHGIVIDDDGSSGEGAAGEGGSGEASSSPQE